MTNEDYGWMSESLKDIVNKQTEKIKALEAIIVEQEKKINDLESKEIGCKKVIDEFKKINPQCDLAREAEIKTPSGDA